jgi:hypothetical protein
MFPISRQQSIATQHEPKQRPNSARRQLTNRRARTTKSRPSPTQSDQIDRQRLQQPTFVVDLPSVMSPLAKSLGANANVARANSNQSLSPPCRLFHSITNLLVAIDLAALFIVRFGGILSDGENKLQSDSSCSSTVASLPTRTANCPILANNSTPMFDVDL